MDKLNSNKIDYIFNYFGDLMTEEEAQAWRHYSSNYKLTHGSEKEPNEAMKQMYLKKGWISTNPDVLQLLDSGIDIFKKNIVIRILKESSDKVQFNNCPKCKELARTPNAKQCRHCGHDWH